MGRLFPEKLFTLLFLCLLLYNVSPQNVPDYFYPFGSDEGDLTGPLNDDGSTGPISLSSYFHYFNNYENALYINTNGVLSFKGGVSQYTPTSFPLDSNPMIAPFWADTDTNINNNGNVFFRQSVNPDLLARATSDVRTHAPEFGTFQASWLLVATWNEVTYYGGDNTTSLNTFQSVLVTNGLLSFAMFNYGDIGWTTGAASGGEGGLKGVPAQVGFNSGDGERYSQVPESQTEDIIKIKSTTNVELPGRWFFRVDGRDIQGGCNSLEGTVTAAPRFGSMLGGKPVYVYGPCCTEGSRIICRFGDQEVEGVLDSCCRAKCIVPQQFENITRTDLQLSIINGGKTTNYTGEFIYIEEEPTFALTRQNGSEWNKKDYTGSFPLVWEPNNFPKVDLVNLDFVTFEMKGTEVKPLATRLVSNVTNSGTLNIPTALTDYDDIALSLYGALRLTPSDNSEIGEVAMWSDLHLSQWFLKLEIITLLKNVFTTGSFPSGIVPINFPNGEDFSLHISQVDLATAISTFQVANPSLNFEQILENLGKIADNVLESLAADMCSVFYNTDRTPAPDFSTLPTPPCTLQQSLVDPQFQADPDCNMGTGCVYTPGAFHCIRSRTATSLGTGQHSCYSPPSNDGQLLPFADGGGAAHRYHYTTPPPFVGNFFYDQMPRISCCVLSPDSCILYTSKRPTSDCAGYSPPSPAYAGGDPHVVTLDDAGYSMNAIGQYWMIQGTGVSMEGRSVRASDPQANESSNLQYALVWSALAAKTENSDTVQVEVIQGFLRVYVNGQMQDFSDLNTQPFYGVSVTLEDEMAQIQFDDLAINITRVHSVLYFSFLVGAKYKGATTGLLGNYNGLAEDDILEGISTGQLFRTTAKDTIFTFRDGESIETYMDPGFEPLVVSNETLLQQSPDIIALCEGNMDCLRDYFITGDKNISLATLKAAQQQETLREATKKVVSCGFPADPENGMANISGSFISNTTTFGCHSGFTQEGTVSSVCQPNGTWTEYETTCTDIDECLAQPCGVGICNNTEGSYNCSCEDGARLVQQSTGPRCMVIPTTTTPTPVSALLQKTYHCETNNPCDPLVVPGVTRYRHTSKSYFIQCMDDGSCRSPPCPRGFSWNQDALNCEKN